jgi:hypothetical protein
MTKNSLARFDNDGIELIINTVTGESFASVSGYARLSGKAKSTISGRFGKVGLSEAQIETTTGRLIPEDLIIKWLPKDNPEMASQLMRLGVRVYLHKLAGFDVSTTATPSTVNTPKTYIEALKALIASEEEKEILRAEKALVEEQNLVLSEVVDELFGYSSIIRVAKFNNVSETNFKWQTLKAVSDKMGIEIKKVPCPRFVWKNLYSHDVWRVCYPNYSLPETVTITVKSN